MHSPNVELKLKTTLFQFSKLSLFSFVEIKIRAPWKLFKSIKGAETFNQTLNDTESCVLPLRNCKLRSRQLVNHCFSDPQRLGCWFSWYPRCWKTMQMMILSFAFLRTGRLLVPTLVTPRAELGATWTASNLIFRKYFWKMIYIGEVVIIAQFYRETHILSYLSHFYHFLCLVIQANPALQ